MVKTQPKSLDKKDRRQVANQLMNLAHIALGSMFFGQVVSDHPFSLTVALVAVLIFGTGYYAAIRLMKGGAEEGGDEA